MCLLIYNIYVESLIFIRKNIYIIVPYYLRETLNWTLGIWVPGNSMSNRFIWYGISMLFFLFLETFTILHVYRKEEDFNPEEDFWQTAYRIAGRIILLSVYYATFFLLSLILTTLLFQHNLMLNKLSLFVIAVILLCSFPVNLRHLIYDNDRIVDDTIKATAKDLYKNFNFYLLVALLGILISWLPSLIAPFTWVAWPFAPTAEHLGSLAVNNVNYFRLFLNPMLSALLSISLTFAFLLKNRKIKPD
jgi:hypothetical protein